MFYDSTNDYTVCGPAGHYNKWLESESLKFNMVHLKLNCRKSSGWMWNDQGKVHSFRSDIYIFNQPLPWYRTHTTCTISFPLGEYSPFIIQSIQAAWATHFRPSCTNHCWVGRGSMAWEVCLLPLHMTNSGNQTPDLMILSPMPRLLGRMINNLAGILLSPFCFWCMITFLCLPTIKLLQSQA